MTIHPKYIRRRPGGRQYVFIHRTETFSGFLAGVKFIDGRSEPTSVRKATRLSAACGQLIRYGFSLEPFEAFGDVPEDAILGFDEGPSESDAKMPETEPAPAEEGDEENDRDEDEEADEDEGESGDEDELSEESLGLDEDDVPAVFTDEDVSASDPVLVTRAFLDSLTKAQICEWAADVLHLDLDSRDKKGDLIDAVMAHPRAAEGNI